MAQLEKIMSIYYGTDKLPYKDEDRQTHYPIAGETNTFVGENNTTKVRFFVDRIGGSNYTWVAKVKKPNGTICFRVLEMDNDDYVDVNLSFLYTDQVGQIDLALNGYTTRDITITENDGDYEISGNPTVICTGIIKIIINYAPLILNMGATVQPNEYQQILALLSTKISYGIESEKVNELPTTGKANTIYYVKSNESDIVYDIYYWNGTTFAYLGTTAYDLYTKEDGIAFENALSSYVNTQLGALENEIQQVASGSPKGVYSTLADLQSAYPTGTNGIYVVLADKHWYYWNGSAWTDGGLYLSANLDEYLKKDTFNEITENNVFNDLYSLSLLHEWEQGSYDFENQADLENSTRIRIKDFIELPKDLSTRTLPIRITNGYRWNIGQYDSDMNFLGESVLSGWETGDKYTLYVGAKYLKIILSKTSEANILPNEGHNNFSIYYDIAFFNKALYVENIICGSKTKNVLDKTLSYDNFRLTDDPPYILPVAGCVVFGPVYVKGQNQITLRSKTVCDYTRWAIFTEKPNAITQNVIAVSGFNASQSGEYEDFTIEIPSNAVFMFYCAKPVDANSDYVNDKLSYGDNGTDDDYVKGDGYGFAKNNEFIPFKSNDDISLSNYNIVKQLEWENTTKKVLPFTYGTPSVNLSFNNSYKRCNLLFFSDSHIDLINPASSLKNVEDTIKLANEAPFDLSAIIHAGDAITDYGSKTYVKNDFAKFMNCLKLSKYPIAFAKGNHDLNDWDNTPERTFDDADWSELIYNYAENNWGMVRQTKANSEKSTYGYIDIDEFKIRIVIVDCQDTDKVTTDGNGKVKYYGGVAWYISNEQMNWLSSYALNFDDKSDKDWGVIVVMHQGTTYSTTLSPQYESAILKFAKICKAFNEQSTYSNTYVYSENNFFNLTISADFTRYANLEKKPHMICWLLGHEHEDKVEVVEGINMIWILNGSATNVDSDARVVRKPSTTTQNAFDVISIDTKARKIRCFRYGAGKNCYGIGGDRFLPDGLDY